MSLRWREATATKPLRLGQEWGGWPTWSVNSSLDKIYKPCLEKAKGNNMRKENIKRKTLTLNYQYRPAVARSCPPSVAANKDKSACPVYRHFSTTAKANEEVNKRNQCLRAAVKGDKFDGVWSTHLCYCSLIDCHGDVEGIGCYVCKALAKKALAQIRMLKTVTAASWSVQSASMTMTTKGAFQLTFKENKRQTIAIVIQKQKISNTKRRKRERINAHRNLLEPDHWFCSRLYQIGLS